MIVSVHHTAISVKDMERSLNFYRDLLGMEVEWEMDHRSGKALSKVVGLADADMRIVMLKGYGHRIELFQYYKPKGTPISPGFMCDPGRMHIAFQVTNIRDHYRKLKEAGVEFNCPPLEIRPGVWATYFRDPDGVILEFIEYKRDG